nr:restriction endonuclease subunit S [Lactobacillus agrestimuris]
MQRKEKKYKALKRSLLQNLFTEKDQVIPTLRFKGFNNEWQRQKGNKLFISRVEKGFPNLTVLSATQDRGMIPRNKSGINIKASKASLESYKKIKPGDFVIHLRSFQGGFAYSSLEGIGSPAYTVFTFKNPQKFNDNFWQEKFTSYKFIELLKKVTYGVRDGRSISYSDFLTLNQKFPSRSEQDKIGNLFSKLDDTIISLHKQKKTLINLKKFLLQNMFI